MVISRETSSRFSPTDFMRARRPELYSDTVYLKELVLNRSQFEFHLDTLTQRKEEIRFEHFCRRLAEKEICPNLLPQTGPTGGGDSKVDAETFPVADTIAERWYVGEPERANRERWAFAFSAKKKWRPKVKEDVRKIVKTRRAYSLIYFITNQAVSDRNRASVEDELREQYDVDVRILDRTWIVERVVQNNRSDIVYQTLDIEPQRLEPKSISGPLDAKRQRDLDELDLLINAPDRYQGSEYQLIEDCLQTALLARGLGHSRAEIDGRFDRAERIARNRDAKQLFHILYQRAWTAVWWFDDFSELDRLYVIIESIVIDSEWVWELDKLVNLWQASNVWRQTEHTLLNNEDWGKHTVKLRNALQRHASNSEKPTSALWARTQLIFMDLPSTIINREQIPSLLVNLKKILEESVGHIDYPVKRVIQIVEELGSFVGNDAAYDELMDLIIQLQEKRIGKAESGRLRLERGYQKLSSGKIYEAIDQLAKAQNLLAHEEHKDDFIRSLVGTALSYEAAGLLWAARANLVAGLYHTLYEYFKDGQIAPQSMILLRKLVWVEIQIGRVPCVLVWLEWLGIISNILELDESVCKNIEEEFKLMDAVLGILVLRTRFADWKNLEHVAGLFKRFSLFMGRSAVLFSLGYEDMLRIEYEDPDSDLDKFFSLWLEQPAAADLPPEAEWHQGKTVLMRTVIMGCKIELTTEKHTTCIIMGETILAFLESFLSTAIFRGHYSVRPSLKLQLRQVDHAPTPFIAQVEEDECGETRILILHSLKLLQLVQDTGYQQALFKLLAIFITELHTTFPLKSLESFFTNDRAQDRAFLVAQSPLSLTNLLTNNPKYQIRDWMDETLSDRLVLKRTKPWKPTYEHVEKTRKADDVSFPLKERPSSDHLFGIDDLKHNDFQILSPINIPLWDKAGWRGLGFSIDRGLANLILLFDNIDIGMKIFRGWRKRLGEEDHDEWIGLTLITGIDRHHPAHYRMAISINEDYLSRTVKSMERFIQGCRMKDMTPTQSNNLDMFLHLYKNIGNYWLAPGQAAPSQNIPLYSRDISIKKRRLRIVPAWQIGPNDPACIAIEGINDPLIPAGISDPPIFKALKWFSANTKKNRTE